MKNRKHQFETDVEHEYDEYVQSTNRPVGPVMKGLLVGGIIGAATMLLFAPRSGDETRAEIRTKAAELRDRTSETVKDTVSQAKTKAYQLKENVWDKAAEIKQRGKQVAAEKLEHAAEAIDTEKQRVQNY